MLCLKCNSEEFVLRNDLKIEQVFRGETFEVESPLMVCKLCGWQAFGPGQADELRKRTADAYRMKHGLLTSNQIKAIRQALKMNQLEFAKFLRVGEASVKRWETWQIQDPSSDELIRLKWMLAKPDESFVSKVSKQIGETLRNEILARLAQIAKPFLAEATQLQFPDLPGKPSELHKLNDWYEILDSTNLNEQVHAQPTIVELSIPGEPRNQQIRRTLCNWQTSIPPPLNDL